MPDFYKAIKLYNTDQVAELLSVSKVTVYRLIESRKLSCYKIKGSIRVSHEDVIKYLEISRMESGTP